MDDGKPDRRALLALIAGIGLASSSATRLTPLDDKGYLGVFAIYVLVTLGSQMLVSDQLIVAQREIAFAAVGEAGAAFAMLPGINDLLAFGSITFLAVFTLINYLHARSTDRTRERVLGSIGAVGCTTAIVVVVVELARNNPATLALIVGCLTAVGFLRFLFTLRAQRSSAEA